MTASNDNRRVRKTRRRARGPESLATMTRVLADIYAHPPNAIVNRQDDLFARLEDEPHAPTVNEPEHDTFPVAEEADR